MMTLGELETFVRYKIPLLAIVINDAAYGAEVHLLQNVGLSSESALFRDNDFAAIASAIGAQGITVRDIADLDRLRLWLDNPRGVMVVDCKVDPQLRGEWFAKVFAPGGWYQRMCGH
jgi:thiamine pyrophosphate-dependent acetolactate synthase large subunit-like protein